MSIFSILSTFFCWLSLTHGFKFISEGGKPIWGQRQIIEKNNDNNKKIKIDHSSKKMFFYEQNK